jgi:hypothetical protein
MNDAFRMIAALAALVAQDISKHQVRFVAVEPDVTLEVPHTRRERGVD